MWMIDFLRILFFQQGSQCSFVFLCSCQTELSVTTLEVFRKSSDIFGYYRTPTKNLGTLKIKNVTPINVKRLAGIGVLCIFFKSHAQFLTQCWQKWKATERLIFSPFFCGLHPVTPNSDQHLIFPHHNLHKESISRMVPSMFFSSFTVKPLLSGPLLSRHSVLSGHLSIFRNLLPI